VYRDLLKLVETLSYGEALEAPGGTRYAVALPPDWPLLHLHAQT
jgi:hypothetical protein